MELYSNNIIYNGLTYNNDCFTICKYQSDLNDVLEYLLGSTNLCSLDIPLCFTDTGNANTVSIIETTTLLNVLQSLLYQSCAGQVKVSGTDLCMGWIGGKITSVDNSVDISILTDSGGCQTLNLSVTPTTVDTSIVKYSNFTPVSSNIPNSFNSSLLKGYDIEPGTLNTDGDALLISTEIGRGSGFASSSIESEIGLSINSLTTTGVVIMYSGTTYIRINLRLSRTSATTLNVKGEIQWYGVGSLIPLNLTKLINTTILVNDLSTGALNRIQVGTYVLPSGQAVYNNYLTIDKFKI